MTRKPVTAPPAKPPMDPSEPIAAPERVASILGETEIVPNNIFGPNASVDALIATATTLVNNRRSNLSAAMEDEAAREAVASLGRQISEAKVFVEDIRLGLVEEPKRWARAIDANGKRVRDALDALRKTVLEPLEAWRTAEAERLAAIGRRIDGIRGLGIIAPGTASVYLEQTLTALDAIVVDATFAERLEEAQTAKEAALVSVSRALASAKAREEQERQAAAEAARLAEEKRLRAEEERLRAEEAARATAERPVRPQLLPQADEEAAREAMRRQDEAAVDAPRQAAPAPSSGIGALRGGTISPPAASSSDVERKRKHNQEAMADLMGAAALTQAGFTQSMAMTLISMIARGQIRHVRIEY